MNRSDFFKRLEQGLSRVTAEERQAALDYYNEYFDDAGEENEQKVIAELGSPYQLAARIKADSAIKHLGEEKKPSVKKGISAVWMVILAIFAAPIALPLAIGAAALAIALILTIICILAALIIGIVALFFGGILLLVAGIAVIATSFPTALFNVGIGLVALGIAILAGVLIATATRGIFGAIAKSINRKLNKSRGDDING